MRASEVKMSCYSVCVIQEIRPRVDIHTHPYTTAARAAGVRTRQLALGCEGN